MGWSGEITHQPGVTTGATSFVAPQEISYFTPQSTNFYHQGVVPHPLFPEGGVCEVEEWSKSVMVSGPSHTVERLLLST